MLQGHRVNFSYRWVTQHIASCPLAGVVRCALPTCAQGLADPGPQKGGFGEPKLDYVLDDDPPSVSRGVRPAGACLD